MVLCRWRNVGRVLLLEHQTIIQVVDKEHKFAIGSIYFYSQDTDALDGLAIATKLLLTNQLRLL